MVNALEDLKHRLPRLTLGELADMVTIHRTEYPGEAISMIERELVRRGVTGISADGHPTLDLEPHPTLESQYGGFWRRLAAYLIDIVVLMPLTGIILLLEWKWQRFAVVVYVPLQLLFPSYLLVSHAISGRSVGKLACGMRVVTLGHDAIGWRIAAQRFSLYIAVFMLVGIGGAIALCTVSPGAWATATLIQKGLLMVQRTPPWLRAVNSAYSLWVTASCLAILADPRKRALHDMIAGTCVIKEPRSATPAI